ncbi:unknown [Collinsella sp. CAG:289]|nr:unknown [Collinsella sp. CAG:289]
MNRSRHRPWIWLRKLLQQLRDLSRRLVEDATVDLRAVFFTWRHGGGRHARPHAIKHAREAIQNRLNRKHCLHFMMRQPRTIEVDKEAACALNARERKRRFNRASAQAGKIHLAHQALCIQLQTAGILIALDAIQQCVDGVRKRGGRKAAKQLDRLIKRMHLDIKTFMFGIRASRGNGTGSRCAKDAVAQIKRRQEITVAKTAFRIPGGLVGVLAHRALHSTLEVRNTTQAPMFIKHANRSRLCIGALANHQIGNIRKRRILHRSTRTVHFAGHVDIAQNLDLRSSDKPDNIAGLLSILAKRAGNRAVRFVVELLGHVREAFFARQ